MEPELIEPEMMGMPMCGGHSGRKEMDDEKRDYFNQVR